MSVLCSRKQMDIMFSKGAPESILSRCTSILCNDDGSTIPLTANMKAQLESRFDRLGLFTLDLNAIAHPSRYIRFAYSLCKLTFGLSPCLVWRCRSFFLFQFCRKRNSKMPCSSLEKDAYRPTISLLWWWKRPHICWIGMLSLL